MKNKLKRAVAILLSAILVVTSDVRVFAVESTITDFCIKIVHTNDIHARVEENEKSERYEDTNKRASICIIRVLEGRGRG